MLYALESQLVVLTPYLAQLREIRNVLDGAISDRDAAELAAAIKEGEGDNSHKQGDEIATDRKGGGRKDVRTGGLGGGDARVGTANKAGAQRGAEKRGADDEGSVECARVRVATGDAHVQRSYRTRFLSNTGHGCVDKA